MNLTNLNLKYKKTNLINFQRYDAENSSHSKNDRLHQWGLVTSDYCTLTGQNKSRTMLMKKWSSAKYYRYSTSNSIVSIEIFVKNFQLVLNKCPNYKILYLKGTRRKAC